MEDGKKVSTDILHVREDRCPDCGSELDTGYECKGCGKDWLHVIEEDKKRRETPCSSASAGADSPVSTGYKTATIKGFVSPDDFVFELFFGNTKSPKQGLCNLPIWKLDDNIYVTDGFRPIKITVEIGEPIRHQNKDANLQRIKDTESNVQDYQAVQGEPAIVS